MQPHSVVVRRKRTRDVVRLHQHWRHMKTRQAVYITQIFRTERRVLVVLWQPAAEFPGTHNRQEYITFAELEKHYTLMAPFPKREGEIK